MKSRLVVLATILFCFARVLSACTCADTWEWDAARGDYVHSPIKIGVNVQAPAYNNLVRDANVGWIRTAVRWSDVEATHGTFNFSGVEGAIDDAHARGLKILAILGHPPVWAGSNANGTTPPSNLTDWQNYVRATAQYFAGRIDAYEIWNEPDLQNSGDGVGWNLDHNSTARPKYADLVVYGAIEIHQWAAGTKVVAPAMSTRATFDRPTRTHQVWQQLETRFYFGQRASSYVDVVSFHSTAIGNDDPTNGPLWWLRNNINDMMTYAPSLDCKEQWITEFGYLAQYGEAQQRDFIIESLANYRGGYGTCGCYLCGGFNFLGDRIRNAFIYVLTDATSGSTYGIHRSDLTPRPVVTDFLRTLPFPAEY